MKSFLKAIGIVAAALVSIGILMALGVYFSPGPLFTPDPAVTAAARAQLRQEGEDKADKDRQEQAAARFNDEQDRSVLTAMGTAAVSMQMAEDYSVSIWHHSLDITIQSAVPQDAALFGSGLCAAVHKKKMMLHSSTWQLRVYLINGTIAYQCDMVGPLGG